MFKIKGRVKTLGFVKIMYSGQWNKITVNWADQDLGWNVWS